MEPDTTDEAIAGAATRGKPASPARTARRSSMDASREGTPLSDALEEMRPALETAASDTVVFARVELEGPAALQRLQGAGLYEAVAVRAERAE